MKGMKEENEKREAKNENILYNEDPNLKSKQRKNKSNSTRTTRIHLNLYLETNKSHLCITL